MKSFTVLRWSVNTLLLGSLLVSVAQAQRRPPRPMDFIIMPSSRAAPEEFAKFTTGPFGLPFVAEPKLRFHPFPDRPAVLRQPGKGGMARASLKVGKDGEVKEVRMVETDPQEGIEKEALAFFKRVVYQAEKREGRAIEFETDAILVFTKLNAKKKKEP